MDCRIISEDAQHLACEDACVCSLLWRAAVRRSSVHMPGNSVSAILLEAQVGSYSMAQPALHSPRAMPRRCRTWPCLQGLSQWPVTSQSRHRAPAQNITARGLSPHVAPAGVPSGALCKSTNRLLQLLCLLVQLSAQPSSQFRPARLALVQSQLSWCKLSVVQPRAFLPRSATRTRWQAAQASTTALLAGSCCLMVRARTLSRPPSSAQLVKTLLRASWSAATRALC